MRKYDTIVSMDGLNFLATEAVLGRLQQRLTPIEQAENLVDTIEGHHPEARKAAVLIPLFEQSGRLYLTFIRRSPLLRSHAGEIAFPGGKVDPGDTSLLMTAVRESQEEIGLDPSRIQPLGVLTPVFTVVSNYIITPVVGFLPTGLGPVSIQESEVSEIITASLCDLANPAIAHTEQWMRHGHTRTIYFYEYASYRIWGATGRMLAALLELLT
jgi:8-oxo-dGTP pyrophosphatase MutT (NUDIX family)